MYRVLLLLGTVIGTRLSYCQDSSYALSGTLVTSRGIVENGLVLISDGSIRGVGSDIHIPPGTTIVRTDGVIFPGLIDLHNHLVWNVLPRWKPTNWPSGNRYDWQLDPDYKKEVRDPEAELIERGMGCDMERYGEIKALLGGATSVVGSFGPTDSDPHRNDCDRGLARNLDYYSGLYSSNMNAEPLEYQVFPFEIPWANAEKIRDRLSNGQTKAFLIHVAEGKDASAAREFNVLRAAGFIRPGTSIIHGVALGDAQFREMQSNGVGLIWSPRSNFELYGTTTDVATAKAVGVIIALAPDWSLSGSNSMAEELRWVRTNKNGIEKIFSDSELLQMVTSNPAKLAGLSDKIGDLSSGKAADIVVFPKLRDGPLLSLLEAQPGSIKLVIVGGKPILGEFDLMQKLLPGRDFDSLTICNYQKSLNISGDTGGEVWNQIQHTLQQELRRTGQSLASLAECN